MKSIKGDIDAAVKITSIDFCPVPMRLTTPYTIAYETINDVTNIFLQIKTSKGISGYGCAAPDQAVTGETVFQALESFETVINSTLIGSDPLRAAALMEQLAISLPNQPSVLAAVDMALYDILGKVAGLPVWKLLGGYRSFIKTSITIGIINVDNTIREAKKFIDQGYTCLKIKGGKDVEDDILRINKLRDYIGPSIELRFDGNQGYTLDDTLYFLKQTEEAALELIEQPIPKGEMGLLEKITNTASLPIMADESLMNLRDAFRLARKDVVDMVNVKLMKVGGISEALQINAVARSAGLEVMVGCMDEAALSIAAGLHYALSRPNIAYADLDGHIGLQHDPSKHSVNIKQGILSPTDQPGLGIILDDEWDCY